MRIAVGIVLVSALLGCKTAGYKDGVLITRNVADVEHCKALGAVQSIPPYAFPGDDLRAIRSRTAAVGADTVLLDVSRTANTSGIAYRCHTEKTGYRAATSAERKELKMSQ
jgi:hypothetical protein